MSDSEVHEPQNTAGNAEGAAVIIVVTINSGSAATKKVRKALASISSYQRAVQFRTPNLDVSVVVGIGADAYERIFGPPKPIKLHPFVEIASEGRVAPSTPGDLIFHIRARLAAEAFELAKVIYDGLGNAVSPIDETHCFRYYDSRDLLGFVDGTENPIGQLRIASVQIDYDPIFEGGSYLIVQKYLHDIDKWGSFTEKKQEEIIGRHKLSNVEIRDEKKKSYAHNVLTKITDDDGIELKIVRDNLPFGEITKNEFGTYFIGYAKNPEVIEMMLRNMFVGKPPGNYDRLLDVSTATTGGLFYVPTVTQLDALGGT